MDVEARRERSRKYARSEKGKLAARRASYRTRYGITIEDYDSMFESQEGRCAICGATSDKPLHIDHDHSTNKVRGLLCRRCNVFLGYIETDEFLIDRALNYLEKNNE